MAQQPIRFMWSPGEPDPIFMKQTYVDPCAFDETDPDNPELLFCVTTAWPTARQVEEDFADELTVLIEYPEGENSTTQVFWVWPTPAVTREGLREFFLERYSAMVEARPGREMSYGLEWLLSFPPADPNAPWDDETLL